MGTLMKTTVELSDDLLARSRRLAQREGTTLRALIEDGLRLALKARGDSARRKKPFKMLTCGGGLTEEAKRIGWANFVNETYREREDQMIAAWHRTKTDDRS